MSNNRASYAIGSLVAWEKLPDKASWVVF